MVRGSLLHGACDLLQARYELAYAHVMNVLKYLIDPASASGGGLPDESRLSAADRQLFLKTVLSASLLIKTPSSFIPPRMHGPAQQGMLC